MSFQLLRMRIQEMTMKDMGRLKIRLVEIERDESLEEERDLVGAEVQKHVGYE